MLCGRLHNNGLHFFYSSVNIINFIQTRGVGRRGDINAEEGIGNT